MTGVQTCALPICRPVDALGLDRRHLLLGSALGEQQICADRCRHRLGDLGGVAGHHHHPLDAVAAQRALSEQRAGELAAEELRGVQQALGTITGEFTSEDLLGRIFAGFCIGK